MAGDNGASGGRADNIINLADFKTARPAQVVREDEAAPSADEAQQPTEEVQRGASPFALAMRAHRALCDWKVATTGATAPKAPRPSVVSRFVGPLAFQNGYPTDETVRRLYDEIDFQRATQAMLRTMPALNMHALRIALGRDFGVDAANKLAIFTPTSSTLMLAADPDAIYGITYLALDADGPTIVELPPGVSGFVNDMWMRPVVEFGPAGGTHLFAPPHHHATALAAPCPATQLQTFGACVFLRASPESGADLRLAHALLKRVRIYPPAKAAAPPAMSYVDASGKSLDATPPNDIRYFEMLARLVTR